MLAFLFQNLFVGGQLDLLMLAVGAFELWMCVDAIRRKEWFWAVFIWLFPGLNAILYFFLVYRNGSSPTMRGFELPGAQNRKRIKELKAQIHHLDKAHHYLQLGDIYFSQGRLTLAETNYRASLQRDAEDIDARAHLGQCLLRQKRAVEALPLLQGVCAENPKHDYGHSMMALAETLTMLAQPDAAIDAWKQVTEHNSYPRAKVQLAELYKAHNQPELAREALKDVVEDDLHAPAFQRKRDRVWVRRAQSLSRQIS